MRPSAKKSFITVIGGTGFVGQSVVQTLLREGYDVQVISRQAEKAKALFPSTAGGGRLLLRNGDITQPKTLQGAFDGSQAVINLVGILFEKGRQRFSTLHSQCAERLAQHAKEAGVKRFLHMSALGVHRAQYSGYASSKVVGEQAVREAFPEATILCPSVIFGPQDDFINQFDQMANIAPALPLIGGGNTRFQPVYVKDVAQAFLACLQDDNTKGKRYELGGPEVLSFKQVLEMILRVTGRKRCLVSVPWGAAKTIGLFGEFLPKPPLTRDQVQLLKSDNVVTKDGFAELGITPQPMQPIIRRYLNTARREASHAA